MASELKIIKRVQLFKVGTHNGEEFTLKDLQLMANSFPKVGYQVPIKFGHVEEPGMPAFGWVTNLYVEGDFLYGDFEVQSFVYDQVKATLYDSLSIEMYYDIARDGVVYEKALKAVALLGAETPGCAGIAPLRDATFAVDTYRMVAKFTEKVTKMAEKDDGFAAQFAQMQAQIAELNSKLTAKDASLEATNQALAAFQEKDKLVSIKAMTDSIKLPAFRSLFTSLLTVTYDNKEKVKVFAADGTSAAMNPTDMLSKVIDMLNQLATSLSAEAISEGDMAAAKPGDTMDPEKDPGKKIAGMIAAHLATNKLASTPANFALAQAAVFKAHPELKSAYVARQRFMN